MIHVFRTEAIVLRTIPFQESDYLVVSLTREFGKLALLARGVRKSESHLAAHLQSAHISAVSFVFGKRFPVITDAAAHFGIIGDGLARVRFAHALAAARLVDRALQASERNKMLYEELAGIFPLFWKKHLNAAYGVHHWSALLFGRVALSLIKALGYSPRLMHCINCKKSPADSEIVFSIPEGGIVHRECMRTLGRLSRPLPRRVLREMQECLAGTGLSSQRAILSMDETRIMRDIAFQFLLYVLGEDLEDSFSRSVL